MIWFLIAVGWIVCAAFTYGIYFGYFQREFPTLAENAWRQDMDAAMLFGLILGPIGLVVSFFLSGFAEHGLKWRITSKENKSNG